MQSRKIVEVFKGSYEFVVFDKRWIKTLFSTFIFCFYTVERISVLTWSVYSLRCSKELSIRNLDQCIFFTHRKLRVVELIIKRALLFPLYLVLFISILEVVAMYDFCNSNICKYWYTILTSLYFIISNLWATKK